MTHTTFTQVWHKHDGGPCPVADTATVMVSYKSGLLDWACQANTFRWINGGGPDSRSVVAAYTTDIFDGNFDHIPDVGEKVLTGKAGDTFTVNTAGEWEKVEPTRGAGCENTPEWLYETINQQRSAK